MSGPFPLSVLAFESYLWGMSRELIELREEESVSSSSRSVLALTGLALVLHGLIHVMGVALLLELGEPGDLTYAVARPEPGSALAIVFAGMWALAAVLFAFAGYLVLRGRPRVWPVLTASVVSLVAIAPMAAAAPVGLVLSAVALALGLWLARRPAGDPLR